MRDLLIEIAELLKSLCNEYDVETTEIALTQHVSGVITLEIGSEQVGWFMDMNDFISWLAENKVEKEGH